VRVTQIAPSCNCGCVRSTPGETSLTNRKPRLKRLSLGAWVERGPRSRTLGASGEA